MEEKNLEEIQKEKLNLEETSVDPRLGENHILKIIQEIRQKNNFIYYDILLPSNGKCGYPSTLKIRELTTLDEKNLLKEMFNSKENALLNLIKKCCYFENYENFNFEDLTTFDQDFILIELSAITFPGEKEIVITDDENHKITTKLNKNDLILNTIPDDFKYPFEIFLPKSNLLWKLKFLTLKNLKEINNIINKKNERDNILTNLFYTIAIITDSIYYQNQEIKFDSINDIINLLENLSPFDLQILSDFFNQKINENYGYKLVKEYYCYECNKEGKIELEPLNFFRITI